MNITLSFLSIDLHIYTQKIDTQKVIEVHRNNWGYHTPGAEVREAPHWIAGRWHVSPPHSSSTCSLSTPPQPAYAPSTSVPTTANLNVYSVYFSVLSNQGSYFFKGVCHFLGGGVGYRDGKTCIWALNTNTYYALYESVWINIVCLWFNVLCVNICSYVNASLYICMCVLLYMCMRTFVCLNVHITPLIDLSMFS